MTTLWNPRKPLNQPPHFGGLSLQAGNAQHLVRATDPLSSVMAAEAAINFADRRLPELLKAGRVRVVQRGGEDLVRGGARVWEAV